MLDETQKDVIYTTRDQKIIITTPTMASFLNVPTGTKTNIYTVWNRVREYIIEHNLEQRGIIMPDEKLGSILIPSYRYNRLIFNNIDRFIAYQ